MTTTTTQELCRTAFDEHADAAMYTKLAMKVTAVIRYVEHQGRWRDTRGARDRIHTAIVKTLDGRLSWDPKRVDLAQHLLSAVSGDIANEVKHAKRFPQVSLDDDRQHLESLEEQTSDAIDAARQGTDERPALLLVEVVAKLRELAPRDKGVQAILDGYVQDAFLRRDVIRVMGISPRAYDAAFKRLLRIAAPLAVEVREALAHHVNSPSPFGAHP